VSFDIFFQPCRFGGAPAEKRNPFTGKTVSGAPNEPLNAAELTAVQQILDRAKSSGPDEHGCYVVDLSDGGTAEVFTGDLATGCMVAMRRITPDLFQFLYDLLEAGNWVLLPAMEDGAAITASPECLKGVPADFPKIVVCGSAEELRVLLTPGVNAWQKYRDQVVRDTK
jgi:hypothetical protein